MPIHEYNADEDYTTEINEAPRESKAQEGPQPIDLVAKAREPSAGDEPEVVFAPLAEILLEKLRRATDRGVEATPPDPALVRIANREVQGMSFSDKAWAILRAHCVVIGKSFHIRDRHTLCWHSRERDGAKAMLRSQWPEFDQVLETEEGKKIPSSLTTFFASNRYDHADGVLFSAVTAPRVTFKGKRYVNPGFAQGLEPVQQAPESVPFEGLMRMIVRCIADDERDPLQAAQAILAGETHTQLAWLLHWCANLRQNPGIPASTVLWLVSGRGGLGKSQFASVLARVIGDANATLINTDELGSGWSDFAHGKSLVYSNEVDKFERQSFADFLKEMVGNDHVSVRQRHVGAVQGPATAVWLFTTNKLVPIHLVDDRRNTLIECIKDVTTGVGIATDWYSLSEADKHIAYQGLAWLLDTIRIDSALIRRPFESALRKNAIDASRNYFEQWLLSDECREWWKLGLWKPTAKIRTKYLDWCEDQGIDKRFTASPLNKYLDHAYSGGLLRKDGDAHGRMNYKEAHGDKRGRGWTLIQRPDDPTVWTGPCAVETPLRSATVSSIDALRDRFGSQQKKLTAFESDLVTALSLEENLVGLAA